jgi:hypothetical protein
MSNDGHRYTKWQGAKTSAPLDKDDAKRVGAEKERIDALKDIPLELDSPPSESI